MGEAVDEGLFLVIRLGQQRGHARRREQAGQHVAVLLIAPVAQDPLVVLGAQHRIEPRVGVAAKEQGQAAHARQEVLLVTLGQCRRQQVVHADPVAALVAVDELLQEGVKFGRARHLEQA